MTRVLLPVEVEIAREKAASLGRVGERLEASLARLAELRRRIELARPEVRPQLARRYAEERSLAATLRYYLVVQREAMGLGRHADVDRAYPLPPAIPIPDGRETP